MRRGDRRNIPRPWKCKLAGEVLEPKPRRPKNREWNFNVRDLLFRMSGKDLMMIEGIDLSTALTILSEIGYEMRKRPTEKDFTGWRGLAPQASGERRCRIKYRRLRKGVNRAARAFR